MITLYDLKEFEGMYYLGNLMESDSDGWYSKEDAEKLLEWYNELELSED